MINEALPRLQKLLIGRNQIGDGGVQALAAALSGGSGALPSLKILFIDSPLAELTAYCSSKSIKLNTF